jgi:acetyl-CoA carboxylase biotin carboxyl carrier protein
MEFRIPLLPQFSSSCNHRAVPDRQLTYEDVLRIVELIKTTSHFSEFRLKVGDIEVSLRRANGGATPSAPAAPLSSRELLPGEEKAPGKERQRSFPHEAHLVRAPMVGTFYHAPQPGAAPYVEVGKSVRPDTQVGIVEVMKLMNAIHAGVSGIVREIVVENAAAVQYGDVLMVIEPQP